jgi:hypothetical protein
MPDIRWSARNQARMHIRNGDPPYAGTTDALRHRPEICTAVAVRATPAGVELLAPFGVGDLVTLTVNPTPAFALKMDAYCARVIAKRWERRWPRLRVNGFGRS